MKRLSEGALLEAFDGASRTDAAFRDTFISSGDANRDTLPELPLLRQRCRDAGRNNPLAVAALGVLRRNVLGKGLVLQSRVEGDRLGWSREQTKKFTEEVERAWRSWSETEQCSLSRDATLGQLAATAYLSAKESGDSFVSLPYVKRHGDDFGLKVQLFEADQVSCPRDKMTNERFAGGLETNERGEVIRYWLSIHPGSYYKMGGMRWEGFSTYGERTGLRLFLHLIDRTRIGQVRGVPWMAPLLLSLKNMERYIQAELTAAVVSGLFTGYVQTEGGVGFKPATTTDGVVDDNSRFDLMPGTVVGLSPGESVSFANPGRPNTAFGGFVENLGRLIGAALSIPWEVLSAHFSSSYSASRGALNMAWTTFEQERSRVVAQFYTPIYKAWFHEAVMTGVLKAPGYLEGGRILRDSYLKADWIGPQPKQIDPLNDAKAAELRIKTELSTQDIEAAQLGHDWTEIHEQRTHEVLVGLADGTLRDGQGEMQDGAKDEEQGNA